MIFNIFIIGTVILIAYIIFDMVQKKKVDLKRRLIWYTFLFYFVCLLHVTTGYIFIPPQKELVFMQYQIVPFQFLIELIDMYRTFGADWLFWETFNARLLSLLMLLPLGFFLPILYKVNQLRSFVWNVLLISVFIEFYQAIFSYFGIITYRIFNMDALILNVLGAIIGYYIFKLVSKYMRLIWE